MADNFSANNVQGVLGEFVTVLDESVSLSVDNVQGVLGQFVPVLDEAAIGPVVEEAGPVAAAFGIPLVIVPGRAVSY